MNYISNYGNNDNNIIFSIWFIKAYKKYRFKANFFIHQKAPLLSYPLPLFPSQKETP